MSDLNTTPLTNAFIDNYLTEAHPMYCTIYIYSLRYSFNNHICIPIKEMAKKFKVLETDVINAWEYWKSKNIVEYSFTDGKNINIEFLSIKTSTTVLQVPEVKSPTKKILLDNKPVYSPKELELYKDNHDNINHLFSVAELSLGKLLSSNDLSTIFGFYDWLRLPVDVIEVLLNYCSENNHRNIRYIEKVALDWAENNINTKEMALNHIKTFNKGYREILKAIGQGNRNPTPKETEYMDKWFNELNMPLNIILEACDKTIMNLGKPQFSYTHKILEGWAKNNVSTIEDIKYLDEKFYKTKEITVSNKPVQPSPKKSKFVNYDQPNRDYDELERLAQERLLSNLKGNENSV